MFSNGSAKIVRETPIEADFRKAELPSAVYHGLGQSALPETGDVITEVYLASTEMSEEARPVILIVAEQGAGALGNVGPSENVELTPGLVPRRHIEIAQ